MWKNMLSLVLIGYLSLGATFAGVHMARNDVGDCIWWGIAGDDEAANLKDECRGSSQWGRDDASTNGDAVCTHTNVPTGFTSTKRSCDFDGAGDYLSIPDGSMADWETVCAWVAPDQDGHQMMAGHWDETPTPDVGIRLFALDFFAFLLLRGYADGVVTPGSIFIPLSNAWSFNCMSWDGTNGGTVTVYSSVVSDATNSIRVCDVSTFDCEEATSVYGNPGVDYTIGIQVGGSFPWAGQIGEVSAYGSVLTDEDVCQICRCGPSNGYKHNLSGVHSNLDSHGDRYHECNKCDLPTNVTHCGPRRIM